MSVPLPVPPAVGEYAVEELARVRVDVARLAAALDELAGQTDVAGWAAEPVALGPLLRGVASDLRRVVNPAARRA